MKLNVSLSDSCWPFYVASRSTISPPLPPAIAIFTSKNNAGASVFGGTEWLIALHSLSNPHLNYY